MKMKNLSFQIIQDTRFPSQSLGKTINEQIIAVRAALKQFNVSFLISEPRELDWGDHFQVRADVYITYLKTDRIKIITAINKVIPAPVYKNTKKGVNNGTHNNTKI
jgi:hypothetical protein